jgi:hypothetical protein
MKKWIFALGAGVGYVLGTRAGREKYERMKLQARQVMENPKVKEATDEAARLVEEGRVAVRDKVRKLNLHDESDLVPSSVGSTSHGNSTPGTLPAGGATGATGATGASSTAGTTGTSTTAGTARPSTPSNGARLEPPTP